jgi:hypothetical protein
MEYVDPNLGSDELCGIEPRGLVVALDWCSQQLGNH